MLISKLPYFIVTLIFIACAQLITTQQAHSGGLGVTTQTAYVDEIYVEKSERKLYLVGKGVVLKEYTISLGNQPKGHKQYEGDGRTPEGVYFITHKNENSQFHLSLGISYPNQQDWLAAQSRGLNPGGDIYIHGGPPSAPNLKSKDWTRGCIGVTNKEIEEIYKYVSVGTKITIMP